MSYRHNNPVIAMTTVLYDLWPNDINEHLHKNSDPFMSSDDARCNPHELVGGASLRTQQLLRIRDELPSYRFATSSISCHERYMTAKASANSYPDHLLFL